MQARVSLGWTLLRPPAPASGSNEDYVSGRHPYARFLFPRHEVFRVNGRSRLQILHALEFGDIHQDSSSHNAGLDVENRKLGTAVLSNVGNCKAVETLPLVERMA